MVVCLTPSDAAEAAAARIASALQEAVARRGQAAVAFSGGKTPVLLLQALALHAIPWTATHVFQVDERIAPDDHPDRNAVDLRLALLNHVALPTTNIHLMPVSLTPAAQAAKVYQRILRNTAKGVLDVVHLGLGDDGHTASLVPGDPVLHVQTQDVATTRPYNGRRRLTLTYPAIRRARSIVWLATGSSKLPMVKRLLAADPTIPAGAMHPSGDQVLFLDAAAAPPS